MKKIYMYSLLFFIIDFFSKLIVKTNLKLFQSIEVIPNFFNITFVYNEGAAFSILEGKKILFILLGLLLIIGLVIFIRKEKLTKYKTLYYSLLIGGVLGNMFDRIFYPGVVDFFDFKLFTYDAPIFNVADSFIVIATILIIIEILGGKNENRSN
ncbi:MAG: signal peptidase II [Erysipelotrichaceae bacterium]|nr:signal peptidase II [Erysipelotrichaceae bacterium]